jgi:hypothetical protein
MAPRSTYILHVVGRGCDSTVDSKEHYFGAQGGSHESSIGAPPNADFGPKPAWIVPIFTSEEVAFV